MERAFLSPLSRCQYLPDRVWQLRYEVSPEMRARDFMGFLREGWRRIGPVLFRPECPSCRMCKSLRVPVASFRTAESQRRAWRKNEAEVEVRIGRPSMSPDRADLFSRFHQHGHDVKGWPAPDEADLSLFLVNPFPTEEWCYYRGDRLVAVGYVDTLPEALSAIYFFYDPAERHRSLGTFNILKLIASAKERGLPHVYLGYYVKGCRSLEYKARFRPNEVLRPDGRWELFDSGAAADPKTTREREPS